MGEEDGGKAQQEDQRGGKLPLPRGTSINQVQRQFVNSLREQMFDTGRSLFTQYSFGQYLEAGAVLSHALFRPNPRCSTMNKDEFWNVLRAHGTTI